MPGTFRITGKQEEGFYRCIADNGVGNPSTRLFLTISPKKTHRQSYECKADNGIGIPATRIFVVVVDSESLRKHYVNGVC